MCNFKNLFFLLLFSIIFTGFAVAQPPPSAASTKSSSSSNNSQNKENFVSLDGGFTIALPQQISAFSGIKATAGVNKGGSNFTWQIPQGFFMIGFADRIFAPNQYKQVLQDSADGLISGVTNDGGKLISKQEISLDGNSGIEVRLHLKEGAVGVTRYLLVKERMFILTTVWADGADGANQLKILDTFKLIDSKAIIAQKIEEATPSPLPQSPVIKKLKTDAEDEGLKGKVKSVTTYDESFSETSFADIKMSSEDFYAENGNQVKHIYYDYRGNPSNITVYGFIDGMRVSKYGYIKYEYNPPSALMPPSTEKPKPVDTRYSTKYEYKYDEKGRLKETVNYRNNGELSYKEIYVYDGNKLEKSVYDATGKMYRKDIDVLDDKQNVIEHTFVSLDSNKPDSKYTYDYQSFDDKGNWTRKTTLKFVTENGKQIYKPISTTYRTITYYQ